MFGIVGLSLVVGVVAGIGFVVREATWRDPIYFAVLVAGLVGTWLVRGDSQPAFDWGTRHAQLAVSTVWALTAACMYHEYTRGGTTAALLLYAKIVIFSFLLFLSLCILRFNFFLMLRTTYRSKRWRVTRKTVRMLLV